MIEFGLSTPGRTDFVPITSQVQDAVSRMGMTDGVCVVFVPHTTAGVTINEGADPDVMRDIRMHLDKMVPWSGGYAHGEGNSAAHIKCSLFGSSVSVLVEKGRLMLGTWQQIYFCEFDGPRTRKVWVKAVGS
jgi:secondary thiamine-phosphate synthase enzyme